MVLDANVLYPFRTRDVLLTFAQLGLFRAQITSTIVDEWTSNLIANKPQLEASIRQQVEAIADAFEECFVLGFELLIEGLELSDKDDRH